MSKLNKTTNQFCSDKYESKYGWYDHFIAILSVRTNTRFPDTKSGENWKDIVALSHNPVAHLGKRFLVSPIRAHTLACPVSGSSWSPATGGLYLKVTARMRPHRYSVRDNAADLVAECPKKPKKPTSFHDTPLSQTYRSSRSLQFDMNGRRKDRSPAPSPVEAIRTESPA